MKRPFRVPVFTLAACLPVLITFARLDVAGEYLGYWAHMPYVFQHGWPTPFAEHAAKWNFDDAFGTSVLDLTWSEWFFPLERWNPHNWTSFRMVSIKAAIFDALLQAALVTATGIVAWRLERRLRTRLYLSVADILSLAAAALVTVGLTELGQLPFISNQREWYLPLTGLPAIDQATISLAIACAVALAVSTAIGYLSRESRKQIPREPPLQDGAGSTDRRRPFLHRSLVLPPNRFSHMPLLTVLVVMLVIALLRIDLIGICLDDCYADSPFYVLHKHGWPAPFAQHRVTAFDGGGISGIWPKKYAPPLFARLVPFKWSEFRLTSAKGVLLDAAVQACLLMATAIVLWRLEKRLQTRFQFSIGDMLSFTAAVGMILGLVCLDRSPSVEGWHEWYSPLTGLPVFEGVMMSLAIACAVGLLVSTAFARMSRKDNEAESTGVETD
jgi:hypothetical protein